MVRLKVYPLLAYQKIYAFQFHYGTIKRRLRGGCGADDINFNSTMVRLKEEVEFRWQTIVLFQFHYGTIKSDSLRNEISLFAIFQFHYGTIKSMKTIFYKELLN